MPSLNEARRIDVEKRLAFLEAKLAELLAKGVDEDTAREQAEAHAGPGVAKPAPRKVTK